MYVAYRALDAQEPPDCNDYDWTTVLQQRIGKIVERAESNFMNNDSNNIVLLDKMIHMSNVQVLAPAPMMTISDYKSSIELLQHENNQLNMKNKKLLELMNRNQKL